MNKIKHIELRKDKCSKYSETTQVQVNQKKKK